MELGIFTFAETDLDPATGRQVGAGPRIRELVAEMETADRVGLDVYGVGEHHRPDYAVSSPAVVLAAGAARTERIRLTSAVSVLSSDDPVRVFQDFAILDQLSRGRAEIMVGRGSFTESFPLFGQELEDYAELFEEKLRLLLEVRAHEVVEWQGSRHRAGIEARGVYPRPFQKPLPVWVATGGTPASVARAARFGLPMGIAIIGGEPARFQPLFDLHRRVAREAGHDPATLPTSVNAHGFLAEDYDTALELATEPFLQTMNRIGRERGWPPMGRAHLEREARLEGPLFLGTPEQVAEKILWQHRLFGHERFLLQLTVGPLPHERVLEAIELFGTEVAPRVRDELGVLTD